MGKLLASDINQDGKRQIVPMSSVLSEDSLRDAQFIRGELKPRVVLLLYSCDNNRKHGLHKRRVFTLAIVPVSNKIYNFCRLRWAILAFGCELANYFWK